MTRSQALQASVQVAMQVAVQTAVQMLQVASVQAAGEADGSQDVPGVVFLLIHRKYASRREQVFTVERGSLIGHIHPGVPFGGVNGQRVDELQSGA